MFYTINYLHDWYYDSGFNEAAGNAQAAARYRARLRQEFPEYAPTGEGARSP